MIAIILNFVRLSLSFTAIRLAFAFQRMKAADVWLTTADAVQLGLVGDAKHPQFKSVQKLIIEPEPDWRLLLDTAPRKTNLVKKKVEFCKK